MICLCGVHKLYSRFASVEGDKSIRSKPALIHLFRNCLNLLFIDTCLFSNVQKFLNDSVLLYVFSCSDGNFILNNSCCLAIQL